jgi:hypothetical protein
MTSMWRGFLTWLASFLVMAATCLPAAHAQKPPERITYSNDPNAEPKERGPPALQYALAVLGAILVLVILCMPSRKKIIT